MEAVRAQPVELNTVLLVRSALRAVFGGPADDEPAPGGIDTLPERMQLMWSEPELRAAMLAELVRTLREVVEFVAERAH